MNLFAAVAITSHLYRGQQQAKASVENVAICNLPIRLISENCLFCHEFRWSFFFTAHVDRLRRSDIPMNLLANFTVND